MRKGILGTVLNSAKQSGGHPRDPAFSRLFPMRNTHSGQVVNELTAMQSSAVHASVRVISETLAGLPLILYKKTDSGKERATGNSLYRILHDQPNPWQTSFEFREMLQTHALLTGAGYAEIVRNGAGRIELLRPLHPRRVRPFKFRDSVAYEYYEQDGTQRVLFTGEIFVIRNMMGDDGITPLSMIDVARESMGLSLATEEHGARLFSNDATPSGVLEHPGKLDDDAVKRLRESWDDTHKGSGNAHTTAVLEGGLSYKAISLSNKDSQFIEARRFQVVDIARIYRVPPHMIGDLEKSAFSNIEQQSLDFIMHTMSAWFRRWEQAVRRDMFVTREKNTLFVEFLVTALLRGDTKTRYEAYSKGILDGWLNRNEVREIEGLNKVEDQGLDDYLVPLNMGVDDSEAEETEEDAAGDTDMPDDTDNAPDAHAARVMQAAVERVERKEAALIDKHGIESLRDERHVSFIMDVLALDKPAAEARIEARIARPVDGD